MKRHITILLFTILASILLSIIHAEGVERSFSINLNKTLRPVNPLFWGANFLFWIEDDASLLDNNIEHSLKELPCTTLRYPGGTVADNFHWKTNLLDNKYRFPYEEGPTESDFDEFMAFCRRVNAVPILVVNTESWWIHQDMDAGAKEAADWVQYCMDKGYNVKYWEIGNETYWHPFMTAKEYGQVVKKYSQAMKAVNPTIKIAANGHWDVEFSGTKERTSSLQHETIRQMYANITSKEDTKAADAYADQYKNTNNRAGSEKWWENVAEECGEYIDMISVHWYYIGNNNMGSMTNNLNLIRDLFKAKYPDREYIMGMTEYNCNHNEHPYAISGLFEGIGRFLMAGVEIGNFWPLRNAIDGNRRSMLEVNTKDEGYAYQVLQLLGNNLKGNLIEISSVDQVFPIATFDGDQLTILVSGRGITKDYVDVTMTLPGMDQFTLIDAKSYDAPLLNRVPIRLIENDVSFSTTSATTCTFKVMPLQTLMLRYKKKNNTAITNVNIDNHLKFFTDGLLLGFNPKGYVKVSVYSPQGIEIAQMYTNNRTKMTLPSAGIYLVKAESLEFGYEVQKMLVMN